MGHSTRPPSKTPSPRPETRSGEGDGGLRSDRGRSPRRRPGDDPGTGREPETGLGQGGATFGVESAERPGWADEADRGQPSGRAARAGASGRGRAGSLNIEVQASVKGSTFDPGRRSFAGHAPDAPDAPRAEGARSDVAAGRERTAGPDP